MKFFLQALCKNISLSLVGLLILSHFNLALSSQDFSLKPFLDSHMHVFFNDGKSTLNSKVLSIKKAFHKKRFERGFIISPSYSISGPLKEIKKLDLLTSQFIQNSFPQKTLGLCAWHFSWSLQQSKKALAHCLSLPHMKGLKIHMAINNLNERKLRHLHDKEIREKFRFLINKYSSKIKFVLIHNTMSIEYLMDFHNSHYAHKNKEKFIQRDFLDLEVITHLATQLKNTQFIMAHSLYHPRLIKQLAQLKNKKNLNNLWLESSAIFKQFHGASAKWIINSWKKFGLDRILFGSDAFISKSPKFESVYNREVDFFRNLKNNQFLTEKEIQRIFNFNGKSFWEKVTK